MPHFIGLHGPDNRARTRVAGRQPAQVPFEMPLDLALGFGHESQTHAVAQAPGDGAEGERPRIPERVQKTHPPSSAMRSAVHARRAPSSSAARSIWARTAGVRAVAAWP